MNILMPMCGDVLYSVPDEYQYPRILTELNGKTLLELSLKSFSDMKRNSNFLFAVPSTKNKELGLADICRVATAGKGSVYEIQGPTAGALCTCLLACDSIDHDSPLIISSADQVIQDDIDQCLDYFTDQLADAGVLTFESVHPKWSYIQMDVNGNVVQVSEKKVVSNNALAGFFYFKRAGDFFESAKNVIRKQGHNEGQYYISAVLNDFILKGKKVAAHALNKEYYNFYDVHAIKKFERDSKSECEVLRELTNKYCSAFQNKDLDRVIEMFCDNADLVDPSVSLTGVGKIREYISDLFASIERLDFDIKSISSGLHHSVIEFVLILNDKSFRGTDIIRWKGGLISSLNAYLYEI